MATECDSGGPPASPPGGPGDAGGALPMTGRDAGAAARRAAGDAPQLAPEAGDAQLLRLHFGGDAARAERRLLLLVGVHGNEHAGMRAANRLLREGFFQRWGEENRSKASLVLYLANPRATVENKRFIDANLNRLLVEEGASSGDGAGGYEAGCARALAAEIDACTHMLDVHTCSAASPPFALPATDAAGGGGGGGASLQLARALPVAFVLRGLAHMTRSGGTTLDWARSRGVVGVGVEAGSHDGPATVGCAAACMRAFVRHAASAEPLREREAAPPVASGGDAAAHKPPRVLVCCGSVPVREGFRWVREVPAFATVSGDEVLATDDVEGELTLGDARGGHVVMPNVMPVLGEEAWFIGVEDSAATEEG